MISYLLFTGSRESIRGSFKGIVDNFKKSLVFKPARIIENISTNGQWGYVAAEAVPGELDKRFLVGNKGLIVINGPYSTTYNSITEMFDCYRSGGADEIYKNLAGSYNVSAITLKYGLQSFGDFSGVYPVYHACRYKVNFVSNSPQCLGRVVGSELSLQSLSWLVGHSNIFLDEYVFEGVCRICPGYEFRAPLGQEQDGTVERLAASIWSTEDRFVDYRDINWKSHLDELTESFLYFYRGASSGGSGSLALSLTGGKDSRMILALALNAGVGGDVSTFTKGPEGSPEIEAASTVAENLGVKHEAKINFLKEQPKHSSSKIWHTLYQSVFRYGGGVCLWDGRTGPVNGLSYDVAGFGGELYRGPGGHAKQFKNLGFLGDSEMMPYWTNYHQKMDPLGILRSEYREFQLFKLEQWIKDNGLFRKDLLPEKFFVENRLSHWNGPLAQMVPGRVKLMPLLNSNLAGDVFKLSPEERNAERAHYELMKLVDKRLVDLPFLGDEWSKLIGHNEASSVAHNYYKEKQPQRSIQAWQWYFVESEREAISRLLRDADEATGLGNMIDVSKLLDFVENCNYKSVVEVKTVMSVVGISISLLEKSSPVADLVSQ